MEILLIVAAVGGAALGAWRMTPKNWLCVSVSPRERTLTIIGSFFNAWN